MCLALLLLVNVIHSFNDLRATPAAALRFSHDTISLRLSQTLEWKHKRKTIHRSSYDKSLCFLSFSWEAREVCGFNSWADAVTLVLDWVVDSVLVAFNALVKNSIIVAYYIVIAIDRNILIHRERYTRSSSASIPSSKWKW